MLGMYARLYLVLFRAHNRFVSFDNSSSGGPSGSNRTRNATSTRTDPQLDPHDGAHSTEARVSGQTSQLPRTNRRLKKACLSVISFPCYRSCLANSIQLARLMLMYPLAYMLVWTLPTSIRIYQVTTGRAAPFALQTVDKACIVIQGVVDAVIYGVNESSLSSWRNLIWPSSFPTLNGANTAAGEGPLFYHEQKGPRIPSARLSDRATLDGGTASSLDITSTATNDSSAQITPEGKNGIELRDLRSEGQDVDTRDPSTGIRKTVEVTVVSSSASKTDHVGFYRS